LPLTIFTTKKQFKRDYINMKHTHLIFKSIIGFMRVTLGPTNSMVDLKLDYIEMYVNDVRVSFFFVQSFFSRRFFFLIYIYI